MVCAVIFKSPITTEPFELTDIIEFWNESIDDYDKTILYRACRRLNDKISSETPYKDFLIYTSDTVKISSKYSIVA
jgi:hypothetical protein